MTNIPPIVADMLQENIRRNEIIQQPFIPSTGEGAPLPRTKAFISDYEPHTIYLPNDIMNDDRMSRIFMFKSISEYARITGITHQEALEEFEVLRCRYDFCYWAWRYVRIKPKDGGDDIPFTLNRPQRRLVEHFEQARLAGKPIRVIVLKARQWGGSTVTQIYMAWLQLIHRKGLNSLIVGHVKTAAAEVSSMFDKVMERYPLRLLEKAQLPSDTEEANDAISAATHNHIFTLDGEESPDNPEKPESPDKKKSKKPTPKVIGDRHSRLLRYIPTRNCKIKVGSAETPNSARGGDSALVHCTEVAFWRKTDNKTPEDIIRSACAGASYKPLTMIVYESTANGTGNFFQQEYDAARRSESLFTPVFVAWWQIERYALPLTNPETFATQLWQQRNDTSVASQRQESGQYLWHLWEMGATLEAINWYVCERRKYNDHGDMAAEFPSDDVEAFQNSGAHVFDPYRIEAFKVNCRPPKMKGDLTAKAAKGSDALNDLHFHPDGGQLWVWSEPEHFDDCRIADRYLVIVDIGGRSAKADWSVICVIDRYWMMEGERPEVCAQWYGHIDMDLLAWKAVQVAHYYDDALLVIESNTLETHDDERWLEGGDQSAYILNEIRHVYPNLYARRQSAEDIRQHAPLKYGFHTNIKTKPAIISTLVEVVREGLYVERDSRCLDEYVTYVRRQNGSYGATDGKHDDLLMTRAIGLHICFHEMPLPSIISFSQLTTAKRHDLNKSIW
ncbi:MAG: terminase [Prevotella sp.]|nr:terminase [Prevotella sp.]